MSVTPVTTPVNNPDIPAPTVRVKPITLAQSEEIWKWSADQCISMKTLLHAYGEIVSDIGMQMQSMVVSYATAWWYDTKFVFE